MTSLQVVCHTVQLSQPEVLCPLLSDFLIVVHLEITPWLSDSCKVSLKQDHHCQDTEAYGMFLLFWTTYKLYRHPSSLTSGT